MRDQNSVTLIGSIGSGYEDKAPVQYKSVSNGNATVANFTVVVKKKGKNGNEFQTFIRVSCWNELADTVNGLAEGTRIHIQGEWRNGSYDKPDGTKVRYSEVSAYSVEPMSGAGAVSPDAPDASGQQPEQYGAAPSRRSLRAVVPKKTIYRSNAADVGHPRVIAEAQRDYKSYEIALEPLRR
jgi:single-stranded DNA-binding protein